jgi:hypothetical protein
VTFSRATLPGLNARRRFLRAAVLYLVLVGGPVAGVLYILRLGERLRVPFALSGTWRIAYTSPDTVASCVPRFGSRAPTLAIEQSGVLVTLRLNDRLRTTLEGRLDDTTLVAWTPPGRAAPTRWRADLALHHTDAGLVGELAGSLTRTDGSACGAVTVLARREPDGEA